jgi:hypothetical protein
LVSTDTNCVFVAWQWHMWKVPTTEPEILTLEGRGTSQPLHSSSDFPKNIFAWTSTYIICPTVRTTYLPHQSLFSCPKKSTFNSITHHILMTWGSGGIDPCILNLSIGSSSHLRSQRESNHDTSPSCPACSAVTILTELALQYHVTIHTMKWPVQITKFLSMHHSTFIKEPDIQEAWMS